MTDFIIILIEAYGFINAIALLHIAAFVPLFLMAYFVGKHANDF